MSRSGSISDGICRSEAVIDTLLHTSSNPDEQEARATKLADCAKKLMAPRPQQTAQQQAIPQQSDAKMLEEPAEAAVIKDLLKSLVSAVLDFQTPV